MNVSRRDTCRLCESRELELVLPLKPSAIADAYVPAERLDEPQEAYPLDAFLCASCGHLQLLDVIDPEVLFGSYIYTSSSSPGLVDHFRGYAERLGERIGLPDGGLAVDVGSNDGVLLRFLKDAGLRVVGVDPARDIARQATAAGIPTIPTFFTTEVAADLRAEHGPAAVVTANNVFAHADALGEIADGVRTLLAPDGVFVFEVSYLLDLVQNMVFDWIYHEHLCYHAIRPLQLFFDRHGMELFDVERIPTKGGSIRGFAQLRDGPRRVSPAVAELVDEESEAGLDRPETFRAFGSRIEAAAEDVRQALEVERAGGGTIAGYGASATVTTLLHHFELGDLVDFIVDDNPDRQGLYSPGHHIPVVPSDALHERRPAAVVVLAWRFADAIIRNNQRYLDAGGRFIVPLPSFRAYGLPG